MEKEFRAFTIRRLFIEDMPLVERYSRVYDGLFFNPLSPQFIRHIFLQGAFWAVYDGDVPAAVTYILPADSSEFSKLNIKWNLTDLLNSPLDDCLVCGYLWMDEKYTATDFYSPIVGLWLSQAARREKSRLIYCIPVAMDTDFEKLFYNGFNLVGLRGLDNLVPHYIFIRQAEFAGRKVEAYEDVKNCPLSDTKGISMLCEKGYVAFDMDVEKNLLFRR